MPILVTDFYTEARIAMERLATLYRNFYGVESIALRYFSVYGPGEESKGEYANLVSQFMWSLRRGEPPKIFGSGRQTRDFTYVEDVVRANIAAYGSKTKFGIYNIGTGVETQVIDMYHLLASKMKKDIAPSLVENPIKNYVDRTCAVTAKAERELGFKAKISLSEGIDRLLAMG
jgi:UDP-glucose 4-epimerase